MFTLMFSTYDGSFKLKLLDVERTEPDPPTAIIYYSYKWRTKKKNHNTVPSSFIPVVYK